MRIDMIAFTQQGYRLGRKLERILNDEGGTGAPCLRLWQRETAVEPMVPKGFFRNRTLFYSSARRGLQCGRSPLSGQQNHRSRRPFSG